MDELEKATLHDSDLLAEMSKAFVSYLCTDLGFENENTRNIYAKGLQTLFQKDGRSLPAMAGPTYQQLVKESPQNKQLHGQLSSAMKHFGVFWAAKGEAIWKAGPKSKSRTLDAVFGKKLGTPGEPSVRMKKEQATGPTTPHPKTEKEQVVKKTPAKVAQVAGKADLRKMLAKVANVAHAAGKAGPKGKAATSAVARQRVSSEASRQKTTDAATPATQPEPKVPLGRKSPEEVKPVKPSTPAKASTQRDPLSVLRSTEKAGNAALLVMQRCNGCHGKTIREVLGATMSGGSKYRAADLNYDIKFGRLEVLPPGSAAGELPKSKVRHDAPCAGQPMPPASMEEFFRFLQCQLRFETKHHAECDLGLVDKEAEAMWPDIEAFVTPNLGATERWVPYHTVLGVHELFLVESVHNRAEWDEKQRWMAMFVFRAHCKRDLFLKAQLPLMLKDSFWKDPMKEFAPGGAMERSILDYRKKTGLPLITSCFRIIPERLLQDDTENLVRSITNRTMKLIEVAEIAWPVIKNSDMPAVKKASNISTLVQDAKGLGETWAKMLTVCVDLAYPDENLLESLCDVGTGASAPLRALLPREKEKDHHGDKKVALRSLLKNINESTSESAAPFWHKLQEAESVLREKFAKSPLVCAQLSTKEGGMSAVTLQVQLCEYRQFRHSVARHKYGLPDDETMRIEPETESRHRAETFIDFDPKSQCVKMAFPTEDESQTIDPIDVPLKATANSRCVAKRVAMLCFLKMKQGASRSDAEQFRDALVKDYTGGEDVPDDCDAWDICRATVSRQDHLVSFHYQLGDGTKVAFQTTAGAVNGSTLQAERIARLCWNKFQTGATKEEVLEYRDELYKEYKGVAGVGEPASKKRKQEAAASNPEPVYVRRRVTRFQPAVEG
jgi:hypothetical protein